MEPKDQSMLLTQYEYFKSENPKKRIRDAAQYLGVSEAELVGIGAHNILLKPDFERILNNIAPLKEVMALTRNDYAVHERRGIYSKASFKGTIGLVVNPDIDLRLFMKNWAFAFAVEDNGRESVQFFDIYGDAVHKIFLTEQSDRKAYLTLVDLFRNPDQHPIKVETKPIVAQVEKLDEDIDVLGFQEGWKRLQDTHEFSSLLRKFELPRLQALRLAPKGFAEQLEVEVIEKFLNLVSSTRIDFMVFVGNKSCLQIHTGKARKIVRTGPWINILDTNFNLHLNDQEIAGVWIVKKPTDQGLVHSIEAYDKEGNIVIQFFGKRKPDIPEDPEWRKVIKEFER